MCNEISSSTGVHRKLPSSLHCPVEEIKNQGYTGTDRSVYRYLKTLKQAEVRASLNPERLQKYTPNTAIWLFVRDPKKLDEIEREDLVAFC